MYNYNEQKAKLFTTEGVKMLMQISANAKRLTDIAGCATIEKVISCASGDTWTMLACIDYLIEIGELRKVHQALSCLSQYEIVASNKR